MLHNNYTQQEYKSYHVIIPANPQSGTGQLLLGDLNAATDEQLMKQHNVKTIITAASGLQHLQIPPQQTHIVFPLMDVKSENIQAYFQLSYQTIQENLKRGGVLVHCGAGISRSATLVIAYYMKKYQTMFNQTLKFVKKIRPNICPNLGFELQLKKYQQTLGLNDNKKAPPIIHQKEPEEGKKPLYSAKQMMLTFNAPIQNKSARMNATNAKVQRHTPIVSRKIALHSSNKRTKLENNEFLIVGKQTGEELKNQSMYQVRKYWPKGNSEWGINRKDNNSLKF